MSGREIVPQRSVLPAAEGSTGAALSEPQVARVSVRLGKRRRLSAELRATPAGVLAAGGAVAAILLAVSPIILAARRRPRS